jgi:ABC-type bacteriocin/lantibiotic exporter with double-glycine peptidase domain
MAVPVVTATTDPGALMALLLPFQLEPQQGHLQCWAAVAVSLGRYYQRCHVPSQQEFARQVLGPNCDQVCPPLQALAQMQLSYQEQSGVLPLPRLRAELAAGHPLLAAMRYFVGWHLVVIYGIEQDDRLWLADPQYGEQCIPYQQLQQQYRQYYSWSHSYVFSSHLAAPAQL